MALQAVLPELARLGATLVAISPQLPEHNRELSRTRQLEFEVLSDRSDEVATTFGARFTLPESASGLPHVSAGSRAVQRGRLVDVADPSPLPHRSAGHHSGGRERPRLHHPTRAGGHARGAAGARPAALRFFTRLEKDRSMADEFYYISPARLEYRDGYRRAYLGEVPEPVVYGVQGALREYYGAKEGPPIASTLDPIVAAGARRMYRTPRVGLAGRKDPLDPAPHHSTGEQRDEERGPH